MRPPDPRPLPWRVLAAAALLGTVACVAMAVLPSLVSGGGVTDLLRAGEEGPSAEAVRADLGTGALMPGGGHDGQQTYVVARDLLDPTAGAPHLDRPAYRYQRVAMPALARALHPTGGGTGLVWALVAVGVLAVAAGGLATGALAVDLGADPRLAAVYGFVPGTIYALGYTLVDGLALAAALAAVSLSLRGRTGWAVAAGVVAVLAKEPVGLVLLGLALWRRDRQGVALVAVPGAVAGAWWVTLRVVLAGWPDSADEFREPLGGLLTAARYWAGGGDPVALGLMAVTVVAGGWALRAGGLRHPLGWALALQLAFLPLLNANVLGAAPNLSRTVAPALVFSLLVLRGADRSAAPADRAATPAMSPA